MRQIPMVLALPLTLAAAHSDAMQDQAQLCDLAAHRAARIAGVPLDILLAISRVETGRDLGNGLSPWPWTINVAGDGAFFDDAQAAIAQTTQLVDAGTENFDVGCFQLNYHWHGGAFQSLDAMFDPDTNALYAANFLATLYQSSGNWPQAIGAYHSQTEERAVNYLSKIDAVLGGGLVGNVALAGRADDADVAAQVLRENNFPLLLAGASGTGGSIVPQTTSRGSLFVSGN